MTQSASSLSSCPKFVPEKMLGNSPKNAINRKCSKNFFTFTCTKWKWVKRYFSKQIVFVRWWLSFSEIKVTFICDKGYIFDKNNLLNAKLKQFKNPFLGWHNKCPAEEVSDVFVVTDSLSNCEGIMLLPSKLSPAPFTKDSSGMKKFKNLIITLIMVKQILFKFSFNPKIIWSWIYWKSSQFFLFKKYVSILFSHGNLMHIYRKYWLWAQTFLGENILFFKYFHHLFTVL